MMRCPYCQCEDSCARESSPVPDRNRASEVLVAVLDLHSKYRWVLGIDPLYLSQELVYFGFFPEHDPPTLLDVGVAQDLISQVERR